MSAIGYVVAGLTSAEDLLRKARRMDVARESMERRGIYYSLEEEIHQLERALGPGVEK